MARVEDTIQRAVIKWVKDTHGSNVIITATRNEAAHFDTAMIGEKGITDLLLFTNGKVLFLELKVAGLGKTKKGVLSKDQIKFNEKFDAKFANNILSRDVAYGYKEAIRIINDWIKPQ